MPEHDSLPRREPFLRQAGLVSATPVVRVAVFGLSTTLKRVLELVFKHARHRPYRYVLHPETDPRVSFDLALVDLTQPQGPRMVQRLGAQGVAERVLTVGRRSHEARRPDDVALGRFAVSVWGALNTRMAALQGALARRSLAPDWGPPHDLQMFLGRRPRVLVLEPLESAQKRVAQALLAQGLDLDLVPSPRHAWQRLSDRSYDLVWLAARAPGWSGFDCLRALKQQGLHRRWPVVLHNSQPRWGDLWRALWLGCSAYLVRPWSADALQQAAERCLRRGLTGHPDRAWMFISRSGAPKL